MCQTCHGKGEIMASNTGEWHKCPACRRGGPNTAKPPKLNPARVKKLIEKEEEEE